MMWSFHLFEMTNSLVTLALGLGGFHLVRYLFSFFKKLQSLPPGPWGVPILGYLPFIKQDNYLEFDSLSQRYGPVFSIKLGQQDCIVICDWTHLREAFANDALLARPASVNLPHIIDTPSILEMSGETWREHRRLSLHVLRDVGFGKSEMETMITKEIEQFLTTLEVDQVDDVSGKLLPSLSNNISALLFGHTFDYSDPEKVSLDKAVVTFSSFFRFAGISIFLPWLNKPLTAIGLMKMDSISNAVMAVTNYCSKEVELHKEAKTTDKERTNDYIYGFLQEQVNRNDEIFNMKTLKRNVSAFFGAGTETVTSTMTWIILRLVHHPDLQERIRSEIAEVVGFDRKPEYSDRTRMPFTQAFIYEVHRAQSVVATNLLRRAIRDTKVGTYNIPKDTLVIFNFWSIHRDPKLWAEPEKFDPERFLNETKDKAIKPPYLVTFSSGKRSCPGEVLANVETFLYLVSILQRYRVKVRPGNQVKFDPIFGITLRPKESTPLIFERIIPK